VISKSRRLCFTRHWKFRIINCGGTREFLNISAAVAQVNLRNVGRQKYARLDTQSDQLQVSGVVIRAIVGLLQVHF